MTSELRAIRDAWDARWDEALAVWSPFTKLSSPRWCMNTEDEQREGLTGSFAMIRLQDHAVVISIAQVAELGLADFSVEVLAHEIGHHVLAPGDLVDNARMIARIRRGLATREEYAPMVANIYTDLLINDRLQRSAGLDIAGVYARLRTAEPDDLWALYMRTYEILWRLSFGTLVEEKCVATTVAADAALAARIVRVYADDWLTGASRFAVLVLPYLLKRAETGSVSVAPWMDALSAGAGGDVPDGLAALDDDEIGEPIHPLDDVAITGVGRVSGAEHPGRDGGVERIGGVKNRYRDPREYVDLMKGLGVDVEPADLVVRFYRELALPYLVPFPSREHRRATDPLPEGLDVWDVGSPVGAIDWVASVSRSPWIIPGVTTYERVMGETAGTEPEKLPVDLFLGVDCSGSMTNPAVGLSYPVLAGTTICLSALRAGAHVKVSLSGEPGSFSETDGFVRGEREILGVLTGYLGTGYAFGIERLRDTFLQPDEERDRSVHVLVVTDADLFYMLKEHRDGWSIAERALEAAGGGGTLVLESVSEEHYGEDLERLASFGWDIHHVSARQQLVEFARAFARRHYGEVA